MRRRFKGYIVLKKGYPISRKSQRTKLEDDVSELTKLGARIELDLGNTDAWYYYVYVFCKATPTSTFEESIPSAVYRKAKELNFGTIYP